ncbi:L-rhamnose isomerase [Occultella gossypii]|uniref:L-rhamnose isomerase n=1 Tax=Occultella gossypii TaxID=2800820 RepID=A0ABS7S563_9MICO|nr:L-rhamnose isomerase [Occultella gossypii]MBZ2195425.1 L-rhamnose isomerase [Occultella gossypii]
MTRDQQEVVDRIVKLSIETQSWGYVSTGTRFKVFDTPGTARDVWEKIDDAAEVHQLTGVTPTVALHIPWDAVDDYAALATYAQQRGVRIGSISPNLFQEDNYRLGSLTHVDASVRAQAIAHVAECIAVAQSTGSRQISLWLADGTNYPGQGDFRRRRRWLEQGLAEIYGQLPSDMSLLLEYKFFEPAFYHTDIADWGQSLLLCESLGPRARVLVDIGHHPLGTNIEHIVATLLGRGRLGGFDLNSKKYGDDDLFVGAVNPHELFLICLELIKAEDDTDPMVTGAAHEILYKIDQCAMVEDKMSAMLRSIDAVQLAFAKALLVDLDELERAQDDGDVVGCNQILDDAYQTDGRPLVRQARQRLGVLDSPLDAYRGSDSARTRERERVGRAAGW